MFSVTNVTYLAARSLWDPLEFISCVSSCLTSVAIVACVEVSTPVSSAETGESLPSAVRAQSSARKWRSQRWERKREKNDYNYFRPGLNVELLYCLFIVLILCINICFETKLGEYYKLSIPFLKTIIAIFGCIFSANFVINLKKGQSIVNTSVIWNMKGFLVFVQ